MCSNPDCFDICDLVCQDERCVTNTTCASDEDCLNTPQTPYCAAGQCVQCTNTIDCNETLSEECLDGVCRAPCTLNEECGLFENCDAASGKCVETDGCISDTQCILWLSQNTTGTSQYDSRLAKCLPSDDDPLLKVCKIPCENDAQCAQFEVCVSGYCKFIGCSDNEECRAYYEGDNPGSFTNQTTTDLRPYITKAICREPPAPGAP
jgi:hypothetical protein